MSKKGLIIVILVLGFMASLTYGAVNAYSLLDKPLGPSLKSNPSIPATNTEPATQAAQIAS